MFILLYFIITIPFSLGFLSGLLPSGFPSSPIYVLASTTARPTFPHIWSFLMTRKYLKRIKN